MTYPLTPGFRDTDTSRNAADFIAPRAPAMRKRLWEEIKQRPQSVYEIELKFGWLNQSTSPRMSELKQMGLAEDTGDRHPAASGQDGAVIRAIDPNADYDAVVKAWKKERAKRKRGVIPVFRSFELEIGKLLAAMEKAVASRTES